MRLAVVAGPAPGHAFPAAALARALTRRGHDVLCLTGPDWQPALARDGVSADVLPLLAGDRRDVDFGFRLWGRAAEMAPAIADRLRPFRPDALVVDTLTVGGAFAAGLLDRPWLELIPHPLQDISRALPAPGTGLAPARGPAGAARDALLRRLHARSLRRAGVQRAAARASLGLPAQGPPAARLVATFPGLEPPRPDWPATAHVVGPLEWDPADMDLPVPPGDEPLMLVSPSTAPSGAPGVLDAALDAAAATRMRVVATQLAAHPGPLPGFARVGPGRQAPLFAVADVVVAGAGHGILAKTLLRGLPLVCVPGGGEQYDNAMRLSRLGAAAAVLPHRLTGPRLAAAVTRVMHDPSVRAAAVQLAGTAAGLGPDYAAATVERVLR